MATTNFKQWDSALTNVESDGSYAGDSMRINGAASGVFPKETFNKVALQAANMAAAIAEMMVAKGYTVEDGSAGTSGHDFTALKAILANLMTAVDKIPTAAAADTATTAGSATTAGALSEGGNVIHTKIISIVDWNMADDGTKVVAHGCTLSKIRSMSASIRPDSDVTPQVLYGCPFMDDSSEVPPDAFIALVDATNINLSRVPAGTFDSVDFHDVSGFVRGWITITYVE